MAVASDIQRTKHLLDRVSGASEQADDHSLLCEILDAAMDDSGSSPDEQILIAQVKRALQDTA